MIITVIVCIVCSLAYGHFTDVIHERETDRALKEQKEDLWKSPRY